MDGEDFDAVMNDHGFRRCSDRWAAESTGSESPQTGDHRDFILGSTAICGSSLPRADHGTHLASHSQLHPADHARRRDPGGCTSHRSMTLYNAPPSIARYELGEDIQIPGGIIAWHADLAMDLDESSIGSGQAASARIVGYCNGTMILTPYGSESDDREHRMTTIELDWSGTNDSLLIAGSHPYREGQVETDSEINRSIIGGTGIYAVARGGMVSTRLENGWYRHDITLID